MTDETIIPAEVIPVAPPAPPRKFYSAKMRGFYAEEIHGTKIPPDCVEVTQEQWRALLNAQSTGKQIVADSNGHPIAVDPVETPAMRRMNLQFQIQALEGRLPRALREFALGYPGAQDRLKEIDQQIIALRAQMPPA